MGSSASVPAPRLARLGGALYLINIICGAFAIGVVPGMLFVSDPATTAHNIQTHELLYRAGLAAHVVVTLTNIGIAAIFYELFKVVNRRLALLDVFFTLVATAIEAAGVVNQFQPLILTGSGPYANALPPEQLHTLAYLPHDLAQADYLLYGIFFGLDIICTGYLVLKSSFMPRTIGILLGIDGLAYLVYGFADILAPGFAAHLVPWIQLPALGELTLALWLLVAGVSTERWMQQPIRPS
ncbi:DUF4386 domain-containing protein [Kitasatospora sp. NPDC097691]|uniref:DUF4386 domain-containing protein n=1 Tax=Kitasatospora sp. NPDC097691 TaxID=3157231 RepID=UPI003330FC04